MREEINLVRHENKNFKCYHDWCILYFKLCQKKQNQASFLNRPAYKQPIHKQDMLSGMAEKSQNGLSLPYIYHYDQIKHNESYFS